MYNAAHMSMGSYLMGVCRSQNEIRFIELSTDSTQPNTPLRCQLNVPVALFTRFSKCNATLCIYTIPS
jgi:hypothetical protein